MLKRVEKTREILKKEGFGALLISSSFNINYLTNFDGFGTHEREGFALLTQSDLYICTDPRLSSAAKKKAKVIEYGSGKKLLPQIQEVLDKEKVKTLGFEENLTFSEYKRFKKLKVKLKMTQEIVEFVRQVKDTQELRLIKKASKLADDCFTYILPKIKLGITEKELSWEMEKFIKEVGGELAFPTIVAFGKNSATPHHKTNDTKLKLNSIILLDFGTKVEGYCTDMTRTLFIGRAPEKFRTIYNITFNAQKKAFFPKKFTGEAIDKEARNIVEKSGYSIPHSVGHGVGLEVHELPHISPGFKNKLDANTVFTIEPGIYVPEFGGVRIEDTVYFNGKEIIQLTNSAKKLIEL